MSVELDSLVAQVKANTDAEASALILIKGLVAKIESCGTNPTDFAALQASLKASAEKLAAAVAANT